MSKLYKKDDIVKWSWGNGTASGKVEKVFYDKTQIQTNGSTILRNGTQDNPAIIIIQDDGTQVLKLASELN